jgi:hypothetical protein
VSCGLQELVTYFLVKARIFRNRLLFLVANEEGIDRAIDLARELRAVGNILNSPNRLEDLSESQQKQLKSKNGSLDLDFRVALTNAYRHLFYPSNDPVKAPKGLMHYTLPAHDASDVKGKNNQQDAILKALKDCQKLRPEGSQPYAAAYVLQKVWALGLESITTKGLKETFSKNLGLNLLFVQYEEYNLRSTIRQGLIEGQWDLKVGDGLRPTGGYRVYIKTDDAPVVPPDMLEFSDRMVLYRRGILEAPKPREIQLNAQVMPSTQANKPVQIRWKAAGALSVKLYRDGQVLVSDRLPSDEYADEISQTVTYRVEADYGEGEVIAHETKAKITQYPTGGGAAGIAADGSGTLFEHKPDRLIEKGSVNAVFNNLRDRVDDGKVAGIEQLEIEVSEDVTDYRRISTALPILMRFPMSIEQVVTMNLAEQFVRLEYQGNVKGFQSFATPINGFLSNPEVRAEVALRIIFEFAAPVLPKGPEMQAIESALGRNPVDRLHLTAKVLY